MADTILTVTTHQIGALDARRAVELVADLLRAELHRLGVPTTRSRVSMRITVPDGGIDASVDTDPIDKDRWMESYIPAEKSAFQIKTGDSFKPWQESAVKAELFGSKPPSKDALGASVRDCLDNGGTYVLICTGTDPNEQETSEAESHFDKFFKQCGYPAADIEIWGQSTIVGLLPFFRESQSRVLEQQDYDWARVAEAFLKQYPDDGMPLARSLLSSFGEDGTITGRFNTKTEEILDIVAERNSKDVWTELVSLLGPPIDSRAFHIRRWLRKGGLTHFPPDAVWQWIDADTEKRAWYGATFVPPFLTRSETEVCWARELLVRYGARKDVRNNLHANFGTESWSGPESHHYQAKKRMFEDFRATESDQNVRRWLDEEIDSLNRRIEDARVREEREF